jgi:hypothetical protein
VRHAVHNQRERPVRAWERLEERQIMAGDVEGQATAVPDRVLLFVTRLRAAMKAMRIYPPGGAIPRQSVQDALGAFNDALEGAESLGFSVTPDGLVFAGSTVYPGSQGLKSFAREFYNRNLAAVRFGRGVTPHEMAQFLAVVNTAPETLAVRGGAEFALCEANVTHISVTEVATRIMEAVLPGGPGESAPLDPDAEAEILPAESIEDLLGEAGAGQTRDRRVLMRVLRDRRTVAKYLRDAREHELEGDVEKLSRRVLDMVRKTHDALPTDRAAVLDVIAEAIMELDPQERGDLYESYLLEQGRLDEAIAATIERLGVEEVVDCILSQIDETPVALKGLSRAVRNLALMNVSADKDAVLDLAVTKMRARGFSEVFIRELGEKVAPRKITGADQKPRAGESPVETVLRLVDMAPDASDAFVYDEAIESLRAEVARGTTDGDVILALVALATAEARETQFLAIISMVEESVSVLVQANETGVAADVAESLAAGAATPEISPAHREHMMRVVYSIASRESLAQVANGLRACRADSAEYYSCHRLLDALGEAAIDPLLEMLADEQDMPARKALIDLLSSCALDHVPKLGAHLADHRWYFVRNLVTILASTRSPIVLPLLERTLRHTDARVRRETIRGLSAIPAATAASLLVAALSDTEAQNVQVTARYLGLVGAVSAVPALEQVALGTGPGNHDSVVRVEAIHALANLGSPSSISVLRALTRRRGLFGGGTSREVREAALGALQVLSAAQARTGVDQ